MLETYNTEERAEILSQMHHAASVFYGMAVQTKCHPFLEFTGLMNEYIKLCKAAHEQGIDFTQANIHTGQALPMESYHIEYLGEKLGCIYGPALDEKKAKILLEAILRD